MSSSNVTSNGVSGQSPARFRVLVVDDDQACLMALDAMLKECGYEVTKCESAEAALSLLRDNRDSFNIVLTEIHMHGMDGYKLLEHIKLEMNLPVIVVSVDDRKDSIIKALIHGARYYLVKPVQIESLRTIWQHSLRK